MAIVECAVKILDFILVVYHFTGYSNIQIFKRNVI